MSFGIGLGAFMDGFERGAGIRDRLDERKRVKENRANLANIETDAKQQFDQAVEQGHLEADQFDEFWMKYALPKRRNELLRQGDVAGARALQEWGESDEARKGGRLFGSAMFKAQTGDAAGALQDAIKAGQVKGYIDHGYELVGQDEIRDAAGTLLGFRLRVKDAEGNEVEQDVTVDDVPRIVSTFANPDSAWQSQVATRERQTKRNEDLEDFEAKEGIKARHAKSSNPDYVERYQKVREDLAKNDLDFNDLSEDEQDKRVRGVLESAERYAGERGAPGIAPERAAPAAAPRRPMIVDEKTGEPVPVAPDQQAPAAKAAVAPDEVAEPARGGAAPGISGAARPAPAARRAPSRAELIAEAADHIKKGGNPEAIAQRLLNAGVAREEWPATLRATIAGGRAPGIGAPGQ